MYSVAATLRERDSVGPSVCSDGKQTSHGAGTQTHHGLQQGCEDCPSGPEGHQRTDEEPLRRELQANLKSQKGTCMQLCTGRDYTLCQSCITSPDTSRRKERVIYCTGSRGRQPPTKWEEGLLPSRDSAPMAEGITPCLLLIPSHLEALLLELNDFSSVLLLWRCNILDIKLYCGRERCQVFLLRKASSVSHFHLRGAHFHPHTRPKRENSVRGYRNPWLFHLISSDSYAFWSMHSLLQACLKKPKFKFSHPFWTIQYLLQ